MTDDEQWAEPSQDQLDIQDMLEKLADQVIRAVRDRRAIAECRASKRGHNIAETPMTSALKSMLELEEHAMRTQRTKQQ